MISTLIQTPKFKGLLSLLIVIHILAVCVFPNPESLLYRQLPWLVTYGNFLGLNTTWRFFSPNPNMPLTEYDVFKRDTSGQLQVESYRYPNKLSEEKSRETHNRFFGSAVWMLARPEFHRDILGPKLCAWHPGAENISIYSRALVMPSVERARLMDLRYESVWSENKQLVSDIDCKKAIEP